MRNKKDREADSEKYPLNKKIETLMGPTIENASAADDNAESKPAKPSRDDQPRDTAASPNDSETENLPPEDDTTKNAVDDIVSKEGDAVLAAEDAELQKSFEHQPPKSLKQKLKNLFKKWWNNPVARWSTLVILLLSIVGLFIFPTTRYFFLNTAGVRSSTSLMVVDESTQLPLKNVQIKINGQTAMTDKEGKAQLHRLKLGRTNINIQKRAFAEVDKTITLGWGSNPLGNFQLKAVGSRYVFVVKDFVSDKAIEKAEATSGEASALSDKDGKIILTVEANDSVELPVTIRAESYRDEQLALNASDKTEQQVKMVPSRKHAFISKRSGKYDLYKIDADGKNESVVLAGTGKEREDVDLFPAPNSDWVALVSTREGTRNKDGFLLSSLLLIDLSNNEVLSVAQSERIQIVGWSGTRLTYVQIAAGASASNPKRQRLMTYDFKARGETKELAFSNTFNDIIQIGNDIYYAPSNTYQANQASGFYKITPDGSKKQTLLDKETWNLFRYEYDKLLLSVQQDWYELKTSDSKANKLNQAPVEAKNKTYIDSPDQKQSLWIEQRDGKGVLIVMDISSKKDKVVHTQSGLTLPARWLNNHTLVYRVHTDQETVDYAISIDGGAPKKIRDVTNTNSSERWYYY